MRPSKAQLSLYSFSGRPPLELKGSWSNELGSEMVITSVKGAEFTGSYKSKVSEDGTAVTGTLVGTVAGDSIGFTVNWEPKYQSVTQWAGKILTSDQGNNYIYTLWTLSHGVEKPDDWWKSFESGADTFWKT